MNKPNAIVLLEPCFKVSLLVLVYFLKEVIDPKFLRLYRIISSLTIKRIAFLTSLFVYNSAQRVTIQLSLLMDTEHIILFKIEHLMLFNRNNGNSMSKTKCYGQVRNFVR